MYAWVGDNADGRICALGFEANTKVYLYQSGLLRNCVMTSFTPQAHSIGTNSGRLYRRRGGKAKKMTQTSGTTARELRDHALSSTEWSTGVKNFK